MYSFQQSYLCMQNSSLENNIKLVGILASCVFWSCDDVIDVLNEP
jgi:hypothetical protein